MLTSKTNLRKHLMMGVVALSLLATPVQAKDVTHRILKAMQNSGGHVFYMGSELGFDGWVVISENGAPSYAYTNKAGGFVNGMLFDTEGKSVTARQIEAMKTERPDVVAQIKAVISGDALTSDGTEAEVADMPDDAAAADTVQASHADMIENGEIPEAQPVKNSAKAEQAYQKAEQASWVSYGDKNAPYLYAFVNPTCEHCTEFLTKDIKEYIDNGQLQVRFIPYGVHKDNTETTVAMLAVENPMEAWHGYVSGDKEALSVKLGTKESIAEARENTKLAAEMRFTALPFIIYRTPSTGEIQVVNGRPENMMLLMSEFVQ